MNLIYHTSHCGSTLLTALLSTVNAATYAEPSSLHQSIVSREYAINFDDILEQPVIIKMPSGLCHTAPHFAVKKIFLYRTLAEHLVKVYNPETLNKTYLSYYFDYMSNVKHSKLQEVELDTDLKKHIFMWANRFLWVKESKNTLWVNCKDLFDAMQSTTTDICNFLEVQPVTNFSVSTIDVKLAGLNHTDIPVNQVQMEIERKKAVGYKHGLIPSMLFEEDEEIMEGCNWLIGVLPELQEYVV